MDIEPQVGVRELKGTGGMGKKRGRERKGGRKGGQAGPGEAGNMGGRALGSRELARMA